MKTKSVFQFVVLLTVAVMLVGCVAVPAVAPKSAFAQGVVALPDDAKVLILSLLTAGVAWLLTKINMGQYTQPIAAALAPLVIGGIEMLLGMIPPAMELDGIVLAVLHWLVLLVSGSVGALVIAKRAKSPTTLLE